MELTPEQEALAESIRRMEVRPLEEKIVRLEKERDEARAIVDEDEGGWTMTRCKACGHRLAGAADHCPQCNAVELAPWHYADDFEYPDVCDCDRCIAARAA